MENTASFDFFFASSMFQKPIAYRLSSMTGIVYPRRLSVSQAINRSHSPPPTLLALPVVTAYSWRLGSQLRAHSGRAIRAARPAPASMLPER